MGTNRDKTSPFTDINGMVAAFLDDAGKQPAPPRVKARLAEIRQAVAEGKANVEMALDIIDMFPSDKAA